MTGAAGAAGLRRRWGRTVLRAQGLLDGEHADRLIPWVGAAALFALLVALDAAALRALEGGSGLGPWLQASWRRQHGMAGTPMAGVDPATGTWSLVSEPVLLATRWVPPEAVFAVVQAAAIALAVVPLWRLARDEAHLRVGASVVVISAFALAPTLHRTNLSAFHPEVIALPALLWAYLQGSRGHGKRFAALVLLVLACRADLGVTVAALGALLALQGRRRTGLLTFGAGAAWSIVAVVAIGPEAPDRALTPAGEFVARATTPLAVLPRLFAHPLMAARELVAEPSVLFLVVVLAPLLFLPLVALRRLGPALPALVLAMVADRAVQRVAQQGVISLSPAAAHIAPAMAFVFVALVAALERIGDRSVIRVNVDHRVVLALLVGATLLFVTEAPTSPYRQPWAWGTRDALDGARLDAAAMVDDAAAVAVSPPATALVAARATVVELPPNPVDLTARRIRTIARQVDVVLLDTTDIDARTGEPFWPDDEVARVLDRFSDAGLGLAFRSDGVYLLRAS